MGLENYINYAMSSILKNPILEVLYDSRLKQWIKRFNGVATKYLESYLAWRRLLDTQKNLSAERLLRIISKRQMICQPLMWT